MLRGCRDELKLKQSGKSLGINKGFVPVINTSGLLIAYATAPNKTALDVGMGSGPYAKALAEESCSRAWRPSPCSATCSSG